MSHAIDSLASSQERTKQLPPDERSRLIAELLESLHEGEMADVEAAWDDEVERRLAAFDNGTLVAIDGEAVLAQARQLAHG
ncbi:MAG: addiction module protein [Xanthomonadales bacterium]|jgi:putative addiction module component (TIGR02574 family)|nr:addiction module protein [Xanthomonadales bacterium]